MKYLNYIILYIYYVNYFAHNFNFVEKKIHY